jgi:hypothetical protein
MTADANSRVPDHRRTEPVLLGGAGLALLGVGASSVWSTVAPPAGVLALGGALAASTLALLGVKRRWPLVGPLSLAAGVVMVGGWYAALKDPFAVWGLAALAGASAMVAARDDDAPERFRQPHQLMTWLTFAVSFMAATLAAYFEWVHVSGWVDAETFILRGAVVTIPWLLAGVALVLHGRLADKLPRRDAGFVLVAVAVGKLLLHDTAYLQGVTRALVFCVLGVVLLSASLLLSRQRVSGARS